MGGGNREDLLAALKRAQDHHRHLDQQVIKAVAESLEIPLSEAFGVASFYAFLFPSPQGKNIIRVCKSVPCYLKGSEMIIQSVKDAIGISPGETSGDGRFSFQLANCIGACDVAPAMLVNDDVHGDLTPARITEILTSYR
jgi:NADH:ubiquinone oxidoreductase subunit E